jgi:hypothetical protein
MPELLNVKVMDTGEELAIPDVEPLDSARKFWELSDKIWRLKPAELRLAAFSMDGAMQPTEAKDALNDVLSQIDNELVVCGTSKAIKLESGYPNDDTELTPEQLAVPLGSYIGTFNWDNRNIWRYAMIAGKKEVVEFTDGHMDYHRELYGGFDFRDNGSSPFIFNAAYSICARSIYGVNDDCVAQPLCRNRL